MNTETNAILIDGRDNVATVIEPIEAGREVRYAAPDGAVRALTAVEDIPVYHKVAVRDIPAGGPAVKYGERIGEALSSIRAGQHVHVHNLTSARETL